MDQIEPTGTEMAVLHHFCRAMSALVNTCSSEVRPELLADAMLSGAFELSRKRFGNAHAAEMLMTAVDVFVEQNPPEAHH